MISEELRRELIKIKAKETNVNCINLIDNVLNTNDIDYVDGNKNTLLIWSAAHFSSLRLMKLIIESDANINYQGHWGMNALMQVAKANNVNKAIILLKYNLDLSLKDYLDRTALEITRICNSQEVEELILKYMENGNRLVRINELKNDNEFKRMIIKRFRDANNIK